MRRNAFAASTMLSVPCTTLTVDLAASTASPNPPTQGNATSITSPINPAQAHGSTGLVTTSATLDARETMSQMVSHALPKLSHRFTGLFPQ